jgi:hypothetical protein
MTFRVSHLALLLFSVACGSVNATVDASGGADAVSGPCTANTTTCTSNQLIVCGSDGKVSSAETCALGCATSGDRCANVDPSNGLATELDGATTGPDAVFASSTMLLTFNTDTGDVTHDGVPFTVPSVVHNQGAGVPTIRVFQFKSLAIRTRAKILGSNAVAFVSRGDVEIAAPVEAAGREGVPGPGAITALNAVCAGQTVTTLFDAGTTNNPRVPGAGGGGLGTNGANGGSAAKSGFQTAAAGVGGQTAGSVTIEPLRGGCRGGNVNSADAGFANTSGGGGGGGLQIASRTKITITSAGVLDAGGGGGGFGRAGVGGGSGGAILVEAPSITVDGTLAANGGGGGCYQNNGQDGLIAYANGSLEALGATCNVAGGVGPGGNGGSKDKAPTNGVSVSTTTPVPVAGGGGGAVGRIRINTAMSGLTKGASSLISPAPSEATIKTR